MEGQKSKSVVRRGGQQQETHRIGDERQVGEKVDDQFPHQLRRKGHSNQKCLYFGSQNVMVAESHKNAHVDR